LILCFARHTTYVALSAKKISGVLKKSLIVNLKSEPTHAAPVLEGGVHAAHNPVEDIPCISEVARADDQPAACATEKQKSSATCSSYMHPSHSPVTGKDNLMGVNGTALPAKHRLLEVFFEENRDGVGE
jgi:hypothetical protein